MNIPIKQLKKWIAALDSGEYKQGRNKLQTGWGHCCLGVGCDVVIPPSKQIRVNGLLSGNVPYSQLNAPHWLVEINRDFALKTGIELTRLNDEKGYTFPEIATLLELVYVHKILD
jgi:hypothetical protein